MKTSFLKTLITRSIVLCIFALPLFVFAEDYIPMVKGLPFITASTNGAITIATFIPGIYKLAVGVASVIAVVVIILAGFQYMTSEAGKSAAKESIRNALIGLLMLLGSYLLLYTINPKLLDINIDLSKGPDDFIDFVAIAQENGSYSGYTERMIEDLKTARALYQNQIEAGDIVGANKTFYSAVTKVNFEKALQDIDGDQDSRTKAVAAINHMNTFYAEQITSAYEEGDFDSAKKIEAEQRSRVDLFKQTAKQIDIERAVQRIKYDPDNSHTAEITTLKSDVSRMYSEAQQTYQYLLERDVDAAKLYRVSALKRIGYAKDAVDSLK